MVKIRCILKNSDNTDDFNEFFAKIPKVGDWIRTKHKAEFKVKRIIHIGLSFQEKDIDLFYQEPSVEIELERAVK